jgi:DHA2 family multidrug resistance protein
MFAFSLWLSSHMNAEWGFAELFWPQAVRGLAVMLCIVPSVGMALEGFAGNELRYASGLFNLMRNLGGAIGIALIDTIIYTRSEPLGQALWTRLQTGDIEAGTFVGAPLQTI